MEELYIGIMSGTSLNGADAVLLEFTDSGVKLLHCHSEAFPVKLFNNLQQLITTQKTSLSTLADIDHQLAVVYSQAASNLLHQAGIKAARVKAIGCHGQTIYHQPEAPNRNSLQLGDPSYIAEITGINVVADFRRRDMASSGQGAPLVPAFHAAVFRNTKTNRIILNIGGIANLTILPCDISKPVTGFDTGPGNTLLDLWARQKRHVPYDNNGEWAAEGKLVDALLEKFLSEPYFGKHPPKSTGRELFNMSWLEAIAGHHQYPDEDIQATLLELTCQSIHRAIQSHAAHTGEIYVCGGGAHNKQMMQRLGELLSPRVVMTTAALGIEPDWVEAAAFGWLAKQTMHQQAGNLTSVTGANHSVVLGGIYPVNHK